MAPPGLPPLLPDESLVQYKEMIASRPYIAMDAYLNRMRERGFAKLGAINAEPDSEKRMALFEDFADFRFAKEDRAEGVWITQGFICEYGFNVSLGKSIYIGPRCTFLDVAEIYIGDRTMIGANTQLLTPTHPLVPEQRNGLAGPEAAQPIRIGDDCWLGGGVIVLAGITIGDGCTIGAGSVVTRSVPPRSVAVGNPARVIKTINLDGTVRPVAKS